MGFFKNKPSIKINGGNELRPSSSSKPSPANAATTPSGAISPTSATIAAEGRDDGSVAAVAGGESREAGGASSGKATTTSSVSRSKASPRKGGAASSSTKQKKKSASGSASNPSSAADPTSPKQRLAKKVASARQARKSLSPTRRGSKAAAANTTEASPATKDRKSSPKKKPVKKKEQQTGASRNAGSSRTRPEKTPKVSNGSAARRKAAPGPRSPAARNRGRTARRHKREPSLSSFDDSSYSSGCSSSDDDSETWYSDTEVEDSTLCTDGSGYDESYVEYGGSSSYAETSFVDSESSTESEEDEPSITKQTVSSRSRNSRSGTRASTMSTSRSKTGKSNKTGRNSLLGSKLSKSTKEKALSTLGNLAESARKDKKSKESTTKNKESNNNTKDNIARGDAAAPVSPQADEKTDVLSDGENSIAEEAPATKSVRSSKSRRDGGEVASHGSKDEFMRKMAEFKTKNYNHQLHVQVMEHGNVEKLMLQELAYVPKPNKPSDIVIKVECSTITLQDCMIRRGKWYEMQSLPFVPGSDFVGTIFDLGDEAKKNSTFRKGDKVAAVVPSGANAKYITLSYQSIIRVPPETDSVVALCLSSAYVPAREALDLARKLNTPFTSANILVIGGNGPSGLATIELALLEGANVYTTADERHHEFLTELGAKCFPIDPKKWLPTLRGKMDVVLDSVCLDGYESSNMALNAAGTLVCTGMSAVYTQGQIRAFGLKDVRDYKAMYCKMRANYMLNNTVYYDRMQRYETAPNEYAQHFRYLCHLATKDSITPLVSARAPLNMIPQMQKAIEHGDTSYGVCVCIPWRVKSKCNEESETS